MEQNYFKHHNVFVVDESTEPFQYPETEEEQIAFFKEQSKMYPRYIPSQYSIKVVPRRVNKQNLQKEQLNIKKEIYTNYLKISLYNKDFIYRVMEETVICDSQDDLMGQIYTLQENHMDLSLF